MENKFYFYEANCRIYLKAQSEDMAEKKIMDINLNDFIISETPYFNIKSEQNIFFCFYHLSFLQTITPNGPGKCDVPT